MLCCFVMWDRWNRIEQNKNKSYVFLPALLRSRRAHNSSLYLTHQVSLLLTFQASGSVDAVLVGADRIATNGDTANKIGTLQVWCNNKNV